MTAVSSALTGKEQLIPLPAQSKVFTLTTDPPGQVTMPTGIHAVVASGDIGIGPEGFGDSLAEDDDEVVHTWKVQQEVGPLWRHVQQVTAMVAPAGIASRDADEVDHLRWVVTKCTWDEVEVVGGTKIRLNINLELQRFDNAWINPAYQVLATGDLMRMPTPKEISTDLT